MKNLLACIVLLTATMSFGQQIQTVRDFSYNNERSEWFDYMTVYKVKNGEVDEHSAKKVSKWGKEILVSKKGRLVGMDFTHINGSRMIFEFRIVGSVEIVTNLNGFEEHKFNAEDAFNNLYKISIIEEGVIVAGDEGNVFIVGKYNKN
ncbi:MAG: hypothetical protein P8P29_03715 [Flavobacteriaceae bacterium]|nr:hypothetical protein [Flavobacteriaceae bacterium]